MRETQIKKIDKFFSMSARVYQKNIHIAYFRFQPPFWAFHRYFAIVAPWEALRNPFFLLRTPLKNCPYGQFSTGPMRAIFVPV